MKSYFDPIKQEDFDVTLNTNAVGPYWLTFAFLPLLEKWKNNGELAKKFVPQIIMTSSMNGWTKVSSHFHIRNTQLIQSSTGSCYQWIFLSLSLV